MSTGKFTHEHRIIVVTDEDYEFGNMPELGNRFKTRYGDATEVENDLNLQLFKIGIVSGYYEAASIDYYEDRYFDFEDVISGVYNYRTLEEFIEDINSIFGISKNKVRKILQKNRKENMQDFLDKGFDSEDVRAETIRISFDEIEEIARDIEEKKCNKYLDDLKKEYGYEEYGVSARFSNGETWYSKINN